MIWFFERNNELLICEIRHADDSDVYEFEVAGAKGPRTERYAAPSDLIAAYLREQSQLRAQGWRPRSGEVASLV